MILVIDDDIAVKVSIQLLLKQNGLVMHMVSSPEEAKSWLSQHSPDLILLDMNFTVDTSGREGLNLLSEIRVSWPEIPVILITGWATMELAIKGMKAGAQDFISKPWTNEHLLQAIRTALDLSKPVVSSTNRKELNQRYDFSYIVGEDPAFLHILETIGRVAATDASILILGESGTGKELIAEAIHQNSLRKNRAFVKVNLGGLSSSLFESELFGHKRGAFTDAKHDRKGRFELADKGSIFLDEIGELEMANQVKLLRVLQDRTFEALGSSQTKSVDIRVICATNRNLAELVAQGLFREDLFYRINLITIHLPALRDRPNDIPLLVNYYLQNLKTLYNRPGLQLDKSAIRWLKTYTFPGNIRQLKNLVERTVLISGRDLLKAEDFEGSLNPGSKKRPEGELPEVGTMTIEEMEKEMIIKAMQHYNNQVSKVAKALGLTRSAMYRRLEKYGIKNVEPLN